MNKSQWGPGPWQSEPDALDWIDERTKLACKIVRHPDFGNFCGYVGVPPTHPYFGWSYDDDIVLQPGDLDDVQVGRDIGYIETFIYALQGADNYGTIPLSFTLRAHRGVNFSGARDNNNSLWWFGFDCGHCDDLQPGMRLRTSPEYQRVVMSQQTYRDLEYVRKECTALAFQLRQLETRVLLDEGMLKFMKRDHA
jgi:hypothetical protein